VADRTLAAFIEATAPATDEELRLLARNLSDLAHVNQLFETSPLGRASFNRWFPVAQSLLSTLERTTDERVPRDAAHASPPASSTRGAETEQRA
jgi:hypothetical protein